MWCPKCSKAGAERFSGRPSSFAAIAVPEAPLRCTKYGFCPDGPGWFVVNARDVRWRDCGPLGAYSDFEGKRPFSGLAINLNVLKPGDCM